MDVSPYEFARQLEAAREFDFPCGKATIRLRYPDYLSFLGIIGAIPAANRADIAVLAHAFLPRCTVGWRGVTEGDLDSSKGSSELEFSPHLIAAVWNRFGGPAGAFRAYAEIDRRIEEERAAFEREKKT
jgi:hypothetical protein